MCGSPVPPNQTSALGLAFSAISWASASPVLRLSTLTLMPLVRLNVVLISVHHSSWAEQIRFSAWVPCALAAVAVTARLSAIHVRRNDIGILFFKKREQQRSHAAPSKGPAHETTRRKIAGQGPWPHATTASTPITPPASMRL